MMHEAIYKLYPQAKVILGEIAFDDFGNIVEYDKESVLAEVTKSEYKKKRTAEYPPITDYLDGVVKGDQAQIYKYIADCLAVKLKYPKA